MRNLFDDNPKQNQHLSIQPAIIQKICLLLFFGFSYGFAQPAIPSTPAGQTLQAWLDAFNSGDRRHQDSPKVQSMEAHSQLSL
jgi:hypothetical protein